MKQQIKVGDSLQVLEDLIWCKTGDIVTVVEVDDSPELPYRCRTPRGGEYWFTVDQVKPSSIKLNKPIPTIKQLNDTTIEVDGVVYEKKAAEKVTLNDVYINNDSRYFSGRVGAMKSEYKNNGSIGHMLLMPTEIQCNRLLAFAALTNCATYFNGCNDWNGAGIRYYISDTNGNWAVFHILFKTDQAVLETERILKEAGLYDYLFI